MASCNFEDLQILLKAPSRELVLRVCNESFLFRERSTLPDSVVKQTAESLTVNNAKSQKLLLSLGSLLKSAQFQGSSEPADIIRLFPGDFHKNLRDLLAKIIIENLSTWRVQAINNQVSLPRLVDFDWRVDIKSASDTISRMSVPTCILQLKVQENATHVKTLPDVSNINVELSKETLDTMLDGLTKIRDQLSSVAKR